MNTDTNKIIFNYVPNECKILNKEFYSFSKNIKIRDEFIEKIDYNILSKLPLHKLTILDLSTKNFKDCKMFYFNKDFNKLINLRVLILQKNSIVSDEEVKKLSSIYTLILNNNNRITIDAIKDLTNLKKIVINQNAETRYDHSINKSNLQKIFKNKKILKYYIDGNAVFNIK